MQWNNTDVNNYATSTIHKYLNETYYNTLPTQDREKLGTKAVQEEFHGITNENGGRVWQQLYGWGTLNVNIWAPSLSEVVGITGELNDDGCYLSAMQGINAANVYWADANGGEQWAYFKQFNASGGGEALWNACNQEITWLRTPVQANTTSVRSVAGNNAISGDATPPTTSGAVHPAVLYNPERPVKQTGLLLLCRQMICLFFSIPME